MKFRKIALILFSLILLVGGIFFFMYKDKIIYVGYIDIIEVDCSEKASILDTVYESDQRIRTENVPFEQFAKEDFRNQELVVSILEKCGMPTLKEVNQKQMNAIWLALQHITEEKYREKYFPLIETAVQNGDLSKEKYALMKDRILMHAGEPQLYGSQIRNGKLYQLHAPEKVNDRRKEMGMQPIEAYLENFNIEYKAIK